MRFRRRTEDGEAYTPEHKKQGAQGIWMLTELDIADKGTTIADVKTNITNLCEMYGWNFVDTSTD